MRTRLTMKPVMMGWIMGLMMLAMAHQMMTGNQTMGRTALLAFVGTHLVVVLAAAAAGVWAARFSPRLKMWLDRLHRPSMRHIGTMLASAAGVAFVVHLYLHGGL